MADKKESSQQTGDTHIHNAPMYNITIGYVDKQINGDYYEYHQNPTAQVPGEGKHPGKKESCRPMKVLFMKDNSATEENVQGKKREAEHLQTYIREHHLSNLKLTTAKDDKLNEVIVAFLKQWQDSDLIGKQLPGAAVFRFLTEDVGITSSVDSKTYANRVKKMVDSTFVSVQTERAVCALLKKK